MKRSYEQKNQHVDVRVATRVELMQGRNRVSKNDRHTLGTPDLAQVVDSRQAAGNQAAVHLEFPHR